MSATTQWTLVALCAVVTIAIKAAGPVALGGRDLPEPFMRLVTFMAPALLAALVCVSAFAEGRDLSVGADTAGVAAGGLAATRGASAGVAVVVAAATTALLRAVIGA